MSERYTITRRPSRAVALRVGERRQYGRTERVAGRERRQFGRER